MEYTINKLAKLAGVSARTLQFYDECGLLTPQRISNNGYRIYGQAEIDRLQQILFYREFGVELSEIRRILSAKNFDGQTALESHLVALQAKQQQLNTLIANVEKSISTMRGETIMSDQEKFEGFKQKLIDDNEVQYGKEIRGKYGNDTIDGVNAKVKGMTQEQYDEVNGLSQAANTALKEAFEEGDPQGQLARKACELHKQWLSFYWPDYSKEAHMGLAQMYVDDPRFTAYYNEIAPGCAVFFRDAMRVFCS